MLMIFWVVAQCSILAACVAYSQNIIDINIAVKASNLILYHAMDGLVILHLFVCQIAESAYLVSVSYLAVAKPSEMSVSMPSAVIIAACGSGTVRC